jgi:hypothetical protein
MSLRKQQSIFVKKIALLILYAYELGYEVTFGDTYSGKFKHKKNSFHDKGLAIDLNLFKGGKWLTSWRDHEVLGLFWESLGGTWGGRFDVSKIPGHQGDGNHYSFGETR